MFGLGVWELLVILVIVLLVNVSCVAQELTMRVIALTNTVPARGQPPPQLEAPQRTDPHDPAAPSGSR